MKRLRPSLNALYLFSVSPASQRSSPSLYQESASSRFFYRRSLRWAMASFSLLLGARLELWLHPSVSPSLTRIIFMRVPERNTSMELSLIRGYLSCIILRKEAAPWVDLAL